MAGYDIPAATFRIETVVVNSRFIATAGFASTVDEARAFIAAVREEMPDATHHVYAYKVGYGNSVIEGMSDDGEPNGTAGPPALAVLRGADIGDTVLVITRYFGGTKLGTGGLVRAYGNAARSVLAELPRTRLIPRLTIGLEYPYNYYELIQRLLAAHEAVVDEQDFGAAVMQIVTLPADNLQELAHALSELSAGQIVPTLLEGDLPTSS